jgi:hypothetical protein
VIAAGADHELVNATQAKIGFHLGRRLSRIAAMQPLYVKLNQIRVGFNGTAEPTCYQHVGSVLRRRGDELGNAVVAFYTIPSASESYTHVAIENQGGQLITEAAAPAKFRNADGWVVVDHVRTELVISTVMNWLRSSPDPKQ